MQVESAGQNGTDWLWIFLVSFYHILQLSHAHLTPRGTEALLPGSLHTPVTTDSCMRSLSNTFRQLYTQSSVYILVMVDAGCMMCVVVKCHQCYLSLNFGTFTINLDPKECRTAVFYLPARKGPTKDDTALHHGKYYMQCFWR